jgi:hypothetical protein
VADRSDVESIRELVGGESQNARKGCWMIMDFRKAMLTRAVLATSSYVVINGA